jgi:hypothetical protein
LTGAQLARRLYVIIKRATWIDVDDLVDDPAGRSNDNLPGYRVNNLRDFCGIGRPRGY